MISALSCRLRLLRRCMLWYISARQYWFKDSDFEVAFVTAADSTHSRSLLQLLESLATWELGSKIVVFDLGLNTNQREKLDQKCIEIGNTEVRTFVYENYPDYFNIEVNAGQYAWKPVIVSKIASELETPFIWMDAGNLINKRLSWVRRFLKRDGFLCPSSSGTIRDWTHEGMLKCLNVSSELLTLTNLNGAVIGFDPRLPRVQDLIDRWAACALRQDCIAPSGSTRENHRQDQAALTVLAYQVGMVSPSRPYYANLIYEPMGLKIQCDIDEKLDL